MKRYEVYDCNDEVIDETNDLVNAQIAKEYDNGSFIFDTKLNKII